MLLFMVLHSPSSLSPHACRLSRRCEDSHTKMKSSHMKRRGCSVQSAGRFQKTHTHTKRKSSGTICHLHSSAKRKTLSLNKRQTMPHHQSRLFLSAYKTDCVILVSVQQGSSDPAGLQEWLTWWMRLLSQHCITKNTSSPSNSSLLAFTEVFLSTADLPSFKPTQQETADGRQEATKTNCTHNQFFHD